MLSNPIAAYLQVIVSIDGYRLMAELVSEESESVLQPLSQFDEQELNLANKSPTATERATEALLGGKCDVDRSYRSSRDAAMSRASGPDADKDSQSDADSLDPQEAASSRPAFPVLVKPAINVTIPMAYALATPSYVRSKFSGRTHPVLLTFDSNCVEPRHTAYNFTKTKGHVGVNVCRAHAWQRKAQNVSKAPVSTGTTQGGEGVSTTQTCFSTRNEFKLRIVVHIKIERKGAK
jgi:hypothetical protein